MALPKKISRVTMVDGVEYRWTVTRQEWFDVSRPVVLTFLAHEVRTERHPKLRVTFHEVHCESVSPALAASFIRGGLKRGWDPRGKEDHSISGDAALKLLCSFEEAQP